MPKKNISQFSSFPRAVRPAPTPLALYLRPGRNDHVELLNLIASGDAACFGVVFDPCQLSRHKELKDQVLTHRLDAILDPKSQPSALPGGHTRALGGLPWGFADRPHQITDFQDTAGRRLIAALDYFVLEQGFTQVIAPTHVLGGADDPWLAVDAGSTRKLRNHLDRGNGASVPIIYSLAVSYAAFRDKQQRRALIESLKTVPMSALWLKIDGFGATSSAAAARTYIQATVEFHELGVPLVADHIGGSIGLAVMAFGAVGGIAHGITLGERFDASAWRKPPTGTGFTPQRRIYVPAIDAMLKPAEADALINASSRAKSIFGCSDTACCQRGVKDMLEKPVRHFLYQRMKEIGGLSQVPEQIRPQRFLEAHLRPTTDKALAAANIDWDDNAMAKKMQSNRKRLDTLRVALGKHAEQNPPKSFAHLPQTRAAREVRR